MANNNESNISSLLKMLKSVLEKGIGNDGKVDYDSLAKNLSDEVYGERVKAQLNVYYEYEKHYLDMLKEYKEEIKFANTIQEDIRKERAAFFAEKLKEVSATLKETGVDAAVQNEWIKNLVESYTNSLNMSAKLAEEHVLDTLNSIKSEEEIIAKHFGKEE